MGAGCSGSIVNPAGYELQSFTVQEMQEQADYALPYMEQEGQNVSIPFRVIDTIGPAYQSTAT